MDHDPITFALLETWTCHGQWLPGDRRGYVSNTLTDEDYRPKRNVTGTPYDRDDARTYERARQLQKHPTIWLAPLQAECVARAAIAAAVDREWLILRGAVMSNHVHMVVANCPDDGPAVRRVLKGVTQAALNRLAGRSGRWWTRGGSDRYKHGAPAIETAVRYVAAQAHILRAIANNELVDSNN
jgi:REP element-mobilizing transposase RayT